MSNQKPSWFPQEIAMQYPKQSKRSSSLSSVSPTRNAFTWLSKWLSVTPLYGSTLSNAGREIFTMPRNTYPETEIDRSTFPIAVSFDSIG